jgi:uncharacterized damage-inducible protein DinB
MPASVDAATVQPMTPTVLQDAFGPPVWATLKLIDVCRELPPEQLETTVPGTYGTILDTMRHIVGSDASYLFVLTGGTALQIDEDAMDLDELRAAMVSFGESWQELVAGDVDGGQVLTRHRPDGSTTTAPVSIRVPQALHHGTDHRSQICTALTTLGVEPPPIDVWDYGWQDGRVTETDPTT